MVYLEDVEGLAGAAVMEGRKTILGGQRSVLSALYAVSSGTGTSTSTDASLIIIYRPIPVRTNSPP